MSSEHRGAEDGDQHGYIGYVVCILCWCDWWLLLDGYCWIFKKKNMFFWWAIQINSWVCLLLYLCIPQSRFVGWCMSPSDTSQPKHEGPGHSATVQDSVALVRRVRALVIREREIQWWTLARSKVYIFLGKFPSIWLFWFYLWVPNSSVIFVLKASTAAPIMLEYHVMYHAVSFSRGWKDSKT